MLTIRRIMRKSGLLQKIWDQKSLISMVIPGILCLIIFSYFPMYGVIIAFKDYSFSKGIMGSDWVGFEHFITLFTDNDFFLAIRNTLAINFIKIIFCFPFPIIFAICLSELCLKRLGKLVQTLSYLPHFLTWVIVYGIFFELLSYDGTINNIAVVFGGERIIYLQEKWFFWPLMTITGIWKEMGWNAIIYIASLSNVNPELFEAAEIDGAGRFAKIRYITFPCILPTVKITLLFTFAGLFNAGFDQIYLFKNDLIHDVAEVLDTYIYNYGLSKNMYSYSTAAGLFQSVVNFIILITANFISKKTTGSGLY